MLGAFKDEKFRRKITFLRDTFNVNLRDALAYAKSTLSVT